MSGIDPFGRRMYTPTLATPQRPPPARITVNHVAPRSAALSDTYGGSGPGIAGPPWPPPMTNDEQHSENKETIGILGACVAGGAAMGSSIPVVGTILGAAGGAIVGFALSWVNAKNNEDHRRRR